jgi:NAD(P)H-dependent FMN reductase
MTRTGIVVGSTRPGRRAEGVARWVHDIATDHSNASFELVDIADFDLPLLDEPTPAAMGPDYCHEHTRRWAQAIASLDGFVFVTPEYNHSTSGCLKNALDFLYGEWKNKAAGFVSYGVSGGERAVEHLRLVMGELHIADVHTQVALSLFSDFDGAGRPDPPPRQRNAVDTMLDEVVAWSEALAPIRSLS